MKMNKGLTLKLLGIMVIAVIVLACSPKKSEQDERIAALEAQLAALSQQDTAKAAEIKAELETAQANREQQSGSTAGTATGKNTETAGQPQIAAPPPSTPKAETTTAQTQTASQPNASGTTATQTAAGSTAASQTTTTGNFEISNDGVLTKYNGNESSVTIPSSVTHIWHQTFANRTNLTSITIPSSVTYIGDSAFSNTGLKSVNIPSSVTIISSGAFNNCTSLSSVKISSSVTAIGRMTFYACNSLTSITIPASVTEIGDVAFDSCNNLMSVTFEGIITNFALNAFPNAGRVSLRNVYYNLDIRGNGTQTATPGTYVKSGDTWARQ